jgi:hypothetical protein
LRRVEEGDMKAEDVVREAKTIREKLLNNVDQARYLDLQRDYIPVPKLGSGAIKLVIIGQDPTVKNEASRDAIKTVLNLDKKNSLYDYLSLIASRLGYDIEQNVYATNLLKCFFVAPPASLGAAVREYTPHWVGLLRKELSSYPDAEVITLGEPVLDALVTDGSRKVRNYWGYGGNNQADIINFRACEADSNLLNRRFLPFPHQPSIRKEFYHRHIEDYISFMASARREYTAGYERTHCLDRYQRFKKV